ncbi:MAG: methyltransferase domain-containing protein [Candidatus Coatesbacteria bacterium]
MRDRYTFGDNDRASERLRKLAELYEPETRDLIVRRRGLRPRVAVDLGCGPGWSTRLLADASKAARAVGLDSSDRYLALARSLQKGDLEFVRHDVTRTPFPVEAPDLLLCRFLLTHLHRPERALAAWGRVAAPGAYLLIHETEGLESGHPAMREYYRLLGRLQVRYGQKLHVGAKLTGLFTGTTWTVIETRALELLKPAAAMAELHLANLRTWRNDPYVRRAFDRAGLNRLEAALVRIASGKEDAGLVRNTARQVVVMKRENRDEA